MCISCIGVAPLHGTMRLRMTMVYPSCVVREPVVLFVSSCKIHDICMHVMRAAGTIIPNILRLRLRRALQLCCVCLPTVQLERAVCMCACSFMKRSLCMMHNVPGELKVSNDCIADLAGRAALECYGVVGMAAADPQDGLMHLLPMYRLRRGIDVEVIDAVPHVVLHVIVEQGVNLARVSENLTSAVRFVLSKICELSNVEVSVHIEDIRH